MKRSVSIIGGGPSALILASFLDPDLFTVTIYEKSKSIGRKFLVAGKGGFNLTHSEPIEDMIEKYSPIGFLDDSLLQFSNSDLRNWLDELNISTFVGSSKRVYPEKGIKPIEVLNAIMKQLKQKTVEICTKYEWIGWDSQGGLEFNNQVIIDTDFVVFALGGSSWKVTGSDGKWLDNFKKHGVEVVDFRPSNCAFEINWPTNFINKFKGEPLKNIGLTCGNRYQKGELVITQFGLEGNAIYALSPQIREQLNQDGRANVYLDLKPIFSEEEVFQKLNQSTKMSISDKLRKSLNLNPAQQAILKLYTSKEEYINPLRLAKTIKNLRIELIGISELDRAISSVGGVPIASVTDQFELNALPNHFCIGEMLDWDAPTGGYLLQACFSMGVKLASHLNLS